jgi:hypothetical protein
MVDLFNDLLNYLKEYPVNEDVDITDFISKYIQVDNTENVIVIFKTLDSLKSKNYITVGSNIDRSTSVLGVDKAAQEYFARNKLTFSRIKIFGSITNDGLFYLEQKSRDKTQGALTESVRTTNKWVKVTSIISVGIAAITGTFIAMQYFKDDGENLKPIYKQFEDTVPLLDSMQKYQRGINSSLRTMANDSLKKVLIETKNK